MIFVHPYDKTTEFLSQIPQALIEENDLQIIKIGLSKKSHDDCINTIKASPAERTIFFFGHGGSNYLLGATGDFANALFIEPESIDNPDLLYNHGHFINQENIDTFNGKKIFCLSCNSGIELGNMALEHGARVFLGFQDIPTDQGEFEKLHLRPDQKAIDLFNNELALIISKSIKLAIERDATFHDVRSLIRLVTNIHSRELIISEPSSENKRQLSDAFFHFKNGIKVFGDGNLKLLA